MLNRIFLYAYKFVALFIFFLVSFSAFADVDLNAPLPVDPELKLAQLRNGLTYYIKKNNTPREKVELRLVVKFGSVDESEEQLGAAHFIEHLAFKNSRKFRNSSLRPTLASIGVEFGRDLNAHTEFDLTRYEISLPSNKKAHLQLGLQVLADFAAHVEIRPEDIAGEEEIIVEEQRLRNNLDYRKSMAMLGSAVPETRYPYRAPIGIESVRKKLTAPMLQRLYRQAYRPDQMAVMVVGDVDVSIVEKMIQKFFSANVNPPNKPRRYETNQPDYTESRLQIFGDEQQHVHELELIYATENERAAQTKAELRHVMIQSQYVEMLRNRLSYFDQAYRSAQAPESNILPNMSRFSIKLEFPKGNAEVAIKGVIARIRQLQQFGFSESELEKVKRRRLNSFEQIFQERDKIDSAYFIKEYRDHFISAENLRSTKQHLALMQELYPTITLDDVNRLAKSQFAASSTIQFLYFSPKSDESTLPSHSELIAYVNAANQQEIREEAPRKRISSLLKTPPATAGTIISETYNALYGTTELLLSNGITVILKKTDFTNQKISMLHQRYGGTSILASDYLSAIYANQLTDRMGFDSLSPRDVQEFLHPRNVSLSLQLSHHSETISGSTSTADLETLFQWNYQRVTNPSRSKVLFSMGVSSIKKSAQQLAAMDDWVIDDQFYKLVFNNDPRIQILPPLSEVETLNIDKVLASFDRFHDNFYGSVFVFVGNVDVGEMRVLLKKYLANLPSKQKATSTDLQYPTPQRGIVKKDVFVGKDNKAQVIVEFHGEITYTDEERLRFKMLEDILQLRLTQSLRDDKSLVYAIGISSEVLSIGGGRYRLILRLPCAPEQIDAVLSALFHEIEDLQHTLPSKSELEKVKKAWAQAHKDSLRKDWYWARQLLESKLNQQPSQFLLASENLLSHITPSSMQRAALHYFDQKNYVQMVVRPQSPAGEVTPEIQEYRSFVPRDLGLIELQQVYRRGLTITVALRNAIKKNETEYVFADRSSDLSELSQLNERLEKLTVSSCLMAARLAQIEGIKLLTQRIETVSTTGTTYVFGDKLSDIRKDKYFELLGEQNKSAEIVSQGIGKCEDGAPEK